MRSRRTSGKIKNTNKSNCKRRSRPTRIRRNSYQRKRFRAVGENQCGICYEDYDDTRCNPYGCGHFFHSGCVERWYNADTHLTNSQCPYCRRDNPTLLSVQRESQLDRRRRMEANMLERRRRLEQMCVWPSTFGDVLIQIPLLSPSIHSIYLDISPMWETNRYLRIDMHLMPTLSQRLQVVEAILNKPTITKIEPFTLFPELDIMKIGRMNYETCPTILNLKHSSTFPFIRILKLMHLLRLNGNTFEKIQFNTLPVESINYDDSPIDDWDWEWEWTTFLTIVGLHAQSVQILELSNLWWSNQSSYDMSTVGALPQVRKLTLESIDLGTLNVATSPYLDTVVLRRWRCEDTVEFTFLDQFKSPLRLLEINLFFVLGGGKYSVLRKIVRLIGDHSDLSIIDSTSLFQHLHNLADYFFQPLANRRVKSVLLRYNNITDQFYAWKESLNDAATIALVQQWRVQE